MNNKGQTLVVFILLLPIIFILLAAAFDLGDLEITKQRYTNEIKAAIKYGLKHIDEENIEAKLKTMLDSNITGDKTIEVTTEKIRINVKTKKEGLFNNVIDNNHDIDITYTGTVNNKIKKE